jgi:hypothetical protein
MFRSVSNSMLSGLPMLPVFAAIVHTRRHFDMTIGYGAVRSVPLVI